MNDKQTPADASRTVNVKLIGVLASALGRREVQLDTTAEATVADVVSVLLKKADNRQFSDLLIDSGTGDPRTNVIILLDDQDCNVFEGMKTRMMERTTVTIIPIAHGG